MESTLNQAAGDLPLTHTYYVWNSFVLRLIILDLLSVKFFTINQNYSLCTSKKIIFLAPVQHSNSCKTAYLLIQTKNFIWMSHSAQHYLHLKHTIFKIRKHSDYQRSLSPNLNFFWRIPFWFAHPPGHTSDCK